MIRKGRICVNRVMNFVDKFSICLNKIFILLIYSANLPKDISIIAQLISGVDNTACYICGFL